MKRRLNSKLNLSKETVDELTTTQLRDAAGGWGIVLPTVVKTVCGAASCPTAICLTGTGHCVTDGCCG